MRYTFFLVIVMILAACGSNRDIQSIAVKINLEFPLATFRVASIDSQNDGFSDIRQRKDDHWAFHVFSAVCDALVASGITPYASNDTADLKVECIVRPGRGFPRLGRHFDLITEYIDFIDIRFIDAKTGKTIGEVEYHRARFADNPPYLVRSMIDRLVQSADKPKGG